MIGFIRRQAVARWRPAPLRVDRSLVIVSDSFFAQTAHHWQRLIPGSTVSHVPVEHHTVLDENSLQAVFESFAAAVHDGDADLSLPSRPRIFAEP